jgi:hypothetical protein
MRTSADRKAEAARYQQMTEQAMKQSAYYDERHGGPYDRGAADAWYGREYNPHYFVGDTYSTAKIELAQMTPAEIVAYTAGYTDNEFNGKYN